MTVSQTPVYTAAIIGSIALAGAGEWQALGAVLVAIICLFPAVWTASRTHYFATKLFCGVVLVTQMVTVPVFYLRPDQYRFADYRPFGFTTIDAIPILLLVGAFLWLVAAIVLLIEQIIGGPPQRADAPRQSRPWSPTLVLSGIIIAIAIALPVKIWMFDAGIGIVGAEPPRLPYHLSGMLTYLFGLVVPATVAALYIKTQRRSMVLAFILVIFAVMIGFTSSSKGSTLIVAVPVIVFAWFDRRWAIFGTSSVMTIVGLAIIVSSRSIVLLTDGVTVTAETGSGVLKLLLETLSLVDWSPSLALVPIAIVGRIEDFQNLVLSYYFNSDAIGGAWQILLKCMNHNWADLDNEALHLESLNYTVPLGFFNVPATIVDWTVMASNRQLFMLFPFAAYAAFILILLEMTLMRIALVFAMNLQLARALLVLATVWFYVGPGTLEFRLMLFFPLTLVLIRFVIGSAGLPSPSKSRSAQS